MSVFLLFPLAVLALNNSADWVAYAKYNLKSPDLLNSISSFSL